MAQRPRVLLLIPHLGGGGAERVTTLLTRGLSADKYELHLGLITESVIASDLVPARVRIHALGAPRIRSAALPLLRLIRRLQPDLILSGMAHLNFLVLLLRPLFPRKTRVVVRQNATVSADLRSGRLPGYTGVFYRLLYPIADRIVCQTKAMAADLSQRSGVGDQQVEVLANPIDADAIRSLRPEAANHWQGPGPHLLAIGRLSREKGFDLLLESFASLRIKFPAAELIILGTGPEQGVLTELCESLRLEQQVRFWGYDSHPERLFPGATLFVLPSRQEGLPNALLEAAAGGLPLVTLPASEGIVNLLAGKQGAWVGTEVSSRALTRELLAALSSIRPGQRFPHPWVEQFHMDCAIQGYERLIDEMLHEQMEREQALQEQHAQ
jgi:glycosyltransferase involved in cell wall biosynthesis